MDDLRSVAREALWYSSWRLTAALNWTHIDFFSDSWVNLSHEFRNYNQLKTIHG
jgi:hypothetical protein